MGTVAISGGAGGYPAAFPYDPDTRYPEYPGAGVSGAPNSVYEAVRACLRGLGLDAERYGTPGWNPLGHLVKPGDRVFIKPNLVTHEYRLGCDCPGDLFSVITHPSVLRAVADFVAIALKGRGEIVLGDNPCIDADWSLLTERTGLHRFGPYFTEAGTPCRVLDLRPMWTDDLTYYGFRSKVSPQSGDPEGESVIDLGDRSWFRGISPLLFRGVFTNRWETIRHHSMGRHRYSIASTILNSDVYISVPKLKSHHKVGATLNIKGLVGINYNKNHLIHWRIGYPGSGGDEYAVAHRAGDHLRIAARHVARDVVPEGAYLKARRRLKGSRLDRWTTPKWKDEHERYRGAWSGNDTCWRMAADLYNLFVRDMAGWRAENKRPARFFSVVDGVLGGEHNGPFCPKSRPNGVVIAGGDLLEVDCVAARLMDFRVRQIRYLDQLLDQHELSTDDIRVRWGDEDAPGFFAPEHRYLRYEPPTGWPELSHHPERAPTEAAPTWSDLRP